MNKLTIGLQGGTGFIGSVLANALVKRGHKIRISTRNINHGRHLWVLPNTKVSVIDLNKQEEIDSLFKGCDVLINLIGILNEKKDDGKGFTYAHTELTSRAVQTCKTNHIKHFIQLSSIGADVNSISNYQKTKGNAENIILSEQSSHFKASIIRPSVVFGPKDKFINKFATLVKLFNGRIPLACPQSLLQPIFVNDLVDAIVAIIENPQHKESIYELGGPEIKTLIEIVRYICEILNIKDRVIPLNYLFSSIQAGLLEFVPGKPLSRDNLRSLRSNSICSELPGLQDLGIKATTMNEIIPSYLLNRKYKDRFAHYRNNSGR